MRIDNIEFCDFMYNENGCGDFGICATDELIIESDRIRKEKGYTDLFTTDIDGELGIYYDYYLIIETEKQKLELLFVCNHGEYDDFCNYEIELTAEEEKEILYKAMKYLMEV